jgi:hypothetical protein
LIGLSDKIDLRIEDYVLYVEEQGAYLEFNLKRLDGGIQLKDKEWLEGLLMDVGKWESIVETAAILLSELGIVADKPDFKAKYWEARECRYKIGYMPMLNDVLHGVISKMVKGEEVKPSFTEFVAEVKNVQKWRAFKAGRSWLIH